MVAGGLAAHRRHWSCALSGAWKLTTTHNRRRGMAWMQKGWCELAIALELDEQIVASKLKPIPTRRYHHHQSKDLLFMFFCGQPLSSCNLACSSCQVLRSKKDLVLICVPTDKIGWISPTELQENSCILLFMEMHFFSQSTYMVHGSACGRAFGSTWKGLLPGWSAWWSARRYLEGSANKIYNVILQAEQLAAYKSLTSKFEADCQAYHAANMAYMNRNNIMQAALTDLYAHGTPLPDLGDPPVIMPFPQILPSLTDFLATYPVPGTPGTSASNAFGCGGSNYGHGTGSENQETPLHQGYGGSTPTSSRHLDGNQS